MICNTLDDSKGSDLLEIDSNNFTPKKLVTEKNNRITPIIYNQKNSHREWCGVSKRWLLKLGLCLTQLFSGNGAIAIFIKELERLKHCTRNRCHLLTQHQGHAGTPRSSQVLHEGLPGLTLSQKSYCFLWLSLHFSSHHHKSFDRQKVSKHTTKWRQNDVKLCEFLLKAFAQINHRTRRKLSQASARTKPWAMRKSHRRDQGLVRSRRVAEKAPKGRVGPEESEWVTQEPYTTRYTF